MAFLKFPLESVKIIFYFYYFIFNHFSPDQWSYIKGYIETCIQLTDYVPDSPIDTEK